MRELAKRDPSFADALKKSTYAKLGRDHPDLRAVRPCPVPLVIVGNKYDIFKVRTACPRPTSDDNYSNASSPRFLRASCEKTEVKTLLRVGVPPCFVPVPT